MEGCFFTTGFGGGSPGPSFDLHWWCEVGVWFVITQHGWKFPFLIYLFLTLRQKLSLWHCSLLLLVFPGWWLLLLQVRNIWSRKKTRKLTAMSFLGLWNCEFVFFSLPFPAFLCLLHMQCPEGLLLLHLVGGVGKSTTSHLRSERLIFVFERCLPGGWKSCVTLFSLCVRVVALHSSLARFQQVSCQVYLCSYTRHLFPCALNVLFLSLL